MEPLRVRMGAAGLRFPGRAWTQPHGRWLGRLSFDDAVSQAVLVDYLCAVDALVQRRRSLIAVLEDAVPASSHATTIARLRCFRGINTLTAAGLCAEVGCLAAEKGFAFLKAPIGRVGMPDIPTPAGYTLEQFIYPDATR